MKTSDNKDRSITENEPPVRCPKCGGVMAEILEQFPKKHKILICMKCFYKETP